MRFRYRAATAEGAEVDGVLDAATRAAALDALRRQALVPIALDDTAARSSVGAAGPGTAVARRGNRAEAVALFARTLGTLLGAGMPLERALAFTAEQATHPAVATALGDVRRQVRDGAPLAASLARHDAIFPPLAIAMLGAGDVAGALAPAADRLADHLDAAAELRAQVRAALLYPALMATVASLGVTVLLLVVVPRFVTMLRDVGGTLPLSTRMLLGASDALVRWWWAWLLLAVAALAALRGWLAVPGNRARWHAARLGLPVVGPLERRWATARVARTLGLLLAGGERLLPALRIAAGAAANASIADGVERAAARVAEGERLAPALAGVVPPLAAQLLAVGEETRPARRDGRPGGRRLRRGGAARPADRGRAAGAGAHRRLRRRRGLRRAGAAAGHLRRRSRAAVAIAHRVLTPSVGRRLTAPQVPSIPLMPPALRSRCSRRRSRSRRAFTLLEVLVVLVVLGILAALVGPQIVGRVSEARGTAARTQMELLALALDTYRLDTGSYPSSGQGLRALRERPTQPPVPPNWRGPYLRKEVPLDPWGRPYEYRSPGRKNPDGFDLVTLGRDATSGGVGEDADLVVP